MLNSAKCQCGFVATSSIPHVATCPHCGAVLNIGNPRWILLLKRLSTPIDRGAGDTVARLLGRFGERFKSWSKKIGMPCGCATRQDDWNRRWPW